MERHGLGIVLIPLTAEPITPLVSEAGRMDRPQDMTNITVTSK